MYSVLPIFKAAPEEFQRKSKKSGSPAYRISSSDLALIFFNMEVHYLPGKLNNAPA